MMFLNHKPLYFILAIIAVIAIAAGLLFAIQNFKTEEEVLSIFPSPRHGEGKGEVEKSSVDDTANWQTYRNEEHGFEFNYPVVLSFNDKGASNYCIKEIELVDEKAFITICATTSESIRIYDADCEKGEGECYRFQPLQCEKSGANSCEEYNHRALSDFWKKEVVFHRSNRSLRVEFDVFLDFSPSTFSKQEILTNEKLATMVREGKISKANLDAVNLFDAVFSTFKFIESGK